MAMSFALGSVHYGCQSIESTRLVGAVEEVATTREETGEHRLFLEVVRPAPKWVQQNVELRDRWLQASFEEDKRRAFRAFKVPTVYELDMVEFQSDPEQISMTGPYIMLQLRERLFVTVKKQHQVTTRSLLSSDAKNSTKEIPIYSLWKWEPHRITRGEVGVHVRATDLEDQHGIWYQQEGQVTHDGLLTISLVPWIDAGLARNRRDPINLVATCPALKISVGIRIDSDVFFHFQQLRTSSSPKRKAGRPSSTTDPDAGNLPKHGLKRL